MSALGFVELEGAGDGFEDGRGDAGEVAALQLGVVLHAHIRERGDLAAAQARYSSAASGGQAGLLGSDLGSPRGQELADLCLVVHAFDGTACLRP